MTDRKTECRFLRILEQSKWRDWERLNSRCCSYLEVETRRDPWLLGSVCPRPTVGIPQWEGSIRG